MKRNVQWYAGAAALSAFALLAVGLGLWLLQAATAWHYPGAEPVAVEHLAPATISAGRISTHAEFYTRDELQDVLRWYLARLESGSVSRPAVSGNCLTFTDEDRFAFLHRRLTVILCDRMAGPGTWIDIGRQLGVNDPP